MSLNVDLLSRTNLRVNKNINLSWIQNQNHEKAHNKKHIPYLQAEEAPSLMATQNKLLACPNWQEDQGFHLVTTTITD
jgi:hypothetical protein